MEKHFSVCEIIEMGIQIEKNGEEFYRKLAEFTDTEELSRLFIDLAEAEKEHAEDFKKIFSGECSYIPEGAYTEEYFMYMKALASEYIFTGENSSGDIAGDVKTFSEGIDLGISAEKDSILFYEEVKRFVDPLGHEKIDQIIEQEKSHLMRLIEIKTGGTE